MSTLTTLDPVAITVVDRATTPTLFYGFIESENPRSLAVATKSGYRPLTHLRCMDIGWLAPKPPRATRPRRSPPARRRNNRRARRIKTPNCPNDCHVPLLNRATE